jgi:competence ComEA-like helix-hairpin-helix protein
MAIYRRRQLAVLLLVLAAAGVGLAVQRWRHAHAALADRLERFDREAGHDAVSPPRDLGTPPPSIDRAPKPAAPAAGSAPVDLNRATEQELRRLPGVGPQLAARIVETRAADGGFASVDDLRRVRGVGPIRLERLRPFLAVAEPSPAAAP